MAGRHDCRYCQTDIRSLFTIEHLTPLSRGGTWDAANLDITCYRCNRLKGKMTDAEFTAHLKAEGVVLTKLTGIQLQRDPDLVGFVRHRRHRRRAEAQRGAEGRFTGAAAELERLTR